MTQATGRASIPVTVELRSVVSPVVRAPLKWTLSNALMVGIKVTPTSAVLSLLLLTRKPATGVVVSLEVCVTGNVMVVKWPWLRPLMEATATVQMVLFYPFHSKVQVD